MSEPINPLFDDDEPMPAWLQKMGTAAKLGPLTPFQNFPVLSLPPNSPTASITITNDERSWEYFYCKIISVAPDGSVDDGASILCGNWQRQQQQHQNVLFQVEPPTGHLAPRGGSSNLCDPNKPYSDTATIEISVTVGDVDSTNSIEKGAPLLVVGTEAETWKYWLQYTFDSAPL